MASTLLLLLLAITMLSSSTAAAGSGRWRVLKKSIGVSAMHMALLPNDKIIVFDRTNSGPSNLSVPNSKCSAAATSSQPTEPCTAHSVEFDSSHRTVRPLAISTDTWCSSGALSSDGVLVQTGGFQAGERVVRFLGPCSGCDWVEVSGGLASPRWYASNQALPDGRIVVVGGKSAFSYEFVPKSAAADGGGTYALPFLEETRLSSKVPNNLYPFLHLSPDGKLFVFANDRAVLLDYVSNRIVRRFPPMPTSEDGGAAVSRNYPSTGSSALLPIFLSRNGTGFTGGVVVLICGGTRSDSNTKAAAGEFVPAVKSCGRIDITEKDATWQMESMPIERTMGDMIMLPTGNVLIVNGARSGTAGWNSARDPVLTPVLYRTRAVGKARFEVMSPSQIPRLYHSTAHLLSDGRVLVGGSNPNRNYNFSTLFPTELSLEAFYPPYLTASGEVNLRPEVTSVRPGIDLGYKQKISVQFRSKHGWKNKNEVYVTVVAPSFTTHSLAMNQRLLVLDAGKVRRGESESDYAVETEAPGSPELAPPGYYLLFVVVDGVPSRGLWIRIH